jgi:hypothetical protein
MKVDANFRDAPAGRSLAGGGLNAKRRNPGRRPRLQGWTTNTRHRSVHATRNFPARAKGTLIRLRVRDATRRAAFPSAKSFVALSRFRFRAATSRATRSAQNGIARFRSRGCDRVFLRDSGRRPKARAAPHPRFGFLIAPCFATSALRRKNFTPSHHFFRFDDFLFSRFRARAPFFAKKFREKSSARRHRLRRAPGPRRRFFIGKTAKTAEFFNPVSVGFLCIHISISRGRNGPRDAAGANARK